MNTQSFAPSTVLTNAANVSPRNDAPVPVVERCVIRLPGNGIEVPVLFKTWIYDEPQSEDKYGRGFLSHKRKGDYVEIITV